MESSQISVKTALISVNATSSRATTRNNRYSNKHVDRNDVNSSTVLVFSYRYEHAEDIIPVCRGCVGGWGNDSLVLTLVRQKETTFIIRLKNVRESIFYPLYIPHTTNIGPPMVVFRTSVPQERTKNAIKNRFAKKS